MRKRLLPVWRSAALLAVVMLCLLDTSLAQAQPAAVAARPAERRVALVIGNAAYRNLPQLANPANDARLLAGTLKELGFTLIGDGPQIDLDKSGFDRAVRTFGEALQNADVGLFYYAGHGLQVNGTNWLVPVEANPTAQRDLDFQMEDADLVLRQMQFASTRLNVIILDACRNNPFRGPGLRAATGGLAEMRAPEGTLIAYATQPGAVAQDGGGGNSPFSAALANTLRQPGLDVFRVFNAVGLQVKRDTRGEQQPWMSSSPIDGEFYFSGIGPSGAPAAVADPDLVFWQSIASSTNPADYQAYLQQFPTGRFAALAVARARNGDAPPAASLAPVPGLLAALLRPPRAEPRRAVQDAQSRLFNASVRSLRWTQGEVLGSYEAYVKLFDVDRGPTGRERDAWFSWSLDSRAGPALDDLRRVLAGEAGDEPIPFTEPWELPFGVRSAPPPSLVAAENPAALQSLAQRYLDAADALIAAATPAKTYYARGDYRDDGFARGRAMHRRLISAYQDFIPAAETLRQALLRQAPAARERFLAGLRAEQRPFAAARLEVVRRARDLVQYYVTAVGEGGSKSRTPSVAQMGLRIDLLEQSFAEYSRLKSEFGAGARYDDSTFDSNYEEVVKNAKYLWRAHRDRKEISSGLHKESDLVHGLNVMALTGFP